MHRNRDGEMQVMGKENYEIQRMGNLNETKTMFLLSTLTLRKTTRGKLGYH